MTAGRQRKGDMDVAAFTIERSEAIAAKRAAQSAHARIDDVRKTLFGARSAELDHALRDLCVTITTLRDADKTERSIDFIGRAEDARELTCPGCDKPVMTRAKQYTTCPHCGKTFRVTVQQRIPRKSSSMPHAPCSPRPNHKSPIANRQSKAGGRNE